MGKIIIFSPYKLEREELNILVAKFPFIDLRKVENVIDKDLIAGVIIKYGSKIFDLSLKGILKNLKRKLYDSY